MNPPAIAIRGLRKNFKQFSLGPLDMTVPHGGIYGFIGPNGSGKTTTIDLLLGMGVESAGDIQILSMNHREHEIAIKRQIGYVSPDLNFQAWGKVGRAIQFTRGFYPTWDQAYCDTLLAAFNLQTTQAIATLSFGSKIKLALVLALAHRPSLLILDEPTVGLDAISKQQVFSQLLSAVEGGNRTVLISSHGLTDLERFTDSIGMIKNGQMLFEGTTAEIVDRFRIVDFITPRETLTRYPRSFCLIDRDATRTRGLIDITQDNPETLKTQGAQEITLTAVTLEEIFVALGKE